MGPAVGTCTVSRVLTVKGPCPGRHFNPEQPAQDQLKTSQNACSPGLHDPGRGLGWGAVGAGWQAGPLNAHQGDFQDFPPHAVWPQHGVSPFGLECGHCRLWALCLAHVKQR